MVRALKGALARNHLVRGSLALLLGSVLSSVAGYLWWTLMARWFGASVVGEVSALGSAAAVVSLLAAQPVGASVVVRYPTLSPHARRAVLPVASLAVASVALAGGLLSAGVLALTGISVLYNPLLFLVFVVNVVLQSLGAFLDNFAMTFRASRLSAARNALSSVLRVLLLVLFAASFAFSGTSMALLATAAVSLVTALAMYRAIAALQSDLPFERSELWPSFLGLRRGAGPQTLISLGSHIPAQVLPALVFALTGAFEGGLFSMAWLVGSVCFMVSSMVSSALMAEGSLDIATLAHRVRHAAWMVSVILLPPVAGLLLFPGKVLTLFGPEFSYASNLLVVVTLSAPFTVAFNLVLTVLRVKELLRPAAFASVLSGGVVVALSLALVPRYGAAAAGWAWLTGQVLGVCLCFPALLADASAGKYSDIN
jgi:O-antigen/teichoic acid export membrane protein